MTVYQKALRYLPVRLREALGRIPHQDRVCEIRLRADLPLSLTDFSGNRTVDERGLLCAPEEALKSTLGEIRETVCRFCGGAMYRSFETLRECFLTSEDGIRLGVLPRGAALHGDVIPEEIAGINMRLPRDVPYAAGDLLARFEDGEPLSTLILSRPGAGKTTLLRSLAAMLSRGTGAIRPMRVAVIDERIELFPKKMNAGVGFCDILSGYPKEKGIETALRLFNPEAMICDEIGSDKEAEAILKAGNGGVLFFASAHAQDRCEALEKPALGRLIRSGVFRKIAVLEKLPGGAFYRCRLTLEDAL